MTIINGIDVSDCLTINIPDHVELVVRYADGQTKTLDYTAGLLAKGGPRVLQLAGSLIKQVKAAYASAGHEVLEVRNVERTHVRTQAELAEIAAGRLADREYDAYRRHHNAVAAMAAGGESHDTI